MPAAPASTERLLKSSSASAILPSAGPTISGCLRSSRTTRDCDLPTRYPPTVDLADKAANSYTKEFLFGMTNTDRAILNMIDAALKRIQTDEYGVCANCQEELQQKRLEAVPWAKHCITCQEKAEKGQL